MAGVADGGLKCSKCRATTLLSKDQYLEDTEDHNLWTLNQDDLPDWIQLAIDESGWTKGRINCPNCQCRIGAFDFVGGSENPVHLIKSKVDHSVPAPPGLAEALQRRTITGGTKKESSTATEPDVSCGASSSLGETSDDTATAATTVSELDSALNVMASEDRQETDSLNDSLLPPVTTAAPPSVPSRPEVEGADIDDEVFEVDEDEEEDDDEDQEPEAEIVQMEFVVDGGGDMRLLTAGKRVKRSKVLKMSQLMKAKKDKEDKFIQEIMNSEPELDNMDPSLICPVCLDLLHDPYSALPCKHTFCETCLRRLGSKNAMDTSCPMCRQRILFCDLQSDLTKTIKLQFPEMYEKRKKFERTNPSVYNMPLPWRPGWRNLISGRPMGGNAFETRSSGELFRRVVQQLPYYIPPVVLANLINLVFFVFLLFAVEVVPTLLGLLMKTKKSLPATPAQLGGGAEKVLSTAASAAGSGSSIGGGSTVSVADSAQSMADVSVASASGEVHDYEEDALESAASALDALANEESILETAAAAAASAAVTEDPGDIDAHIQAFYPSPEGASMVMDTTFYYALYLVLFIGTLVGNFFLLNHPTTLIPRGSVLERWFFHPRWGRFNRRLLDVILVLALTTIPIITLPLLMSSSASFAPYRATARAANVEGGTVNAAGEAGLHQQYSKSLFEVWFSRLVEYCSTFYAFPYFLVALVGVWVFTAYFFDCHDDIE